jgi:hypothetical protein
MTASITRSGRRRRRRARSCGHAACRARSRPRSCRTTLPRSARHRRTFRYLDRANPDPLRTICGGANRSRPR